MSAAELSIGIRMASGTRVDVREALWVHRTLVKTYGPRGTVHLLPAEDLPLWTGALSAIPSAPHAMPEGVRLTPEQTEAVIAAIDVALADAEMTVDELTEAVVASAGAWAGDLVMPAFQGFWPRWCQAIATAARRGVLCFGPNRGRRTTYTHPRRWLPGFEPMDGQAALAEIVRRYQHSYGPATPAHFAQWLGVPRGWAVKVFESLPESGAGIPEDVPEGVRLLPYFDAYVVGSHPREQVFPGRAADRALARGQAGNYPVLLVDGVVAGVWHQRRSGRKIEITVEPLGGLTAKQRRELDDQVARVGEVLEGQPRLTIGTVAVGPHA